MAVFLGTLSLLLLDDAFRIGRERGPVG